MHRHLNISCEFIVFSPDGENLMSPRISMITLGVRDLEIAINFYERGLGFPKKNPLQISPFSL